MTFRELQLEVNEWSCRNFPNNQPIDPLLGVVEEVGELAHAVLKIRQNIRGGVEEHRIEMLDAVGDVVIYLADFCNRNGVDFSTAVMMAWGTVRQRDWQKFPKNGRTE